MRILCVGGGPAGLYFAVLSKLADPAHEVTVLERNPAGVTYGWGVVFWDDLLDDLFRCDPVSARMLWDAAARWDEYEVRASGKSTTHLAGYGFSLGRHLMLDILARRAAELGVEIRYDDELTDPGEVAAAYPDADLVVACDGAGSRLRERDAARFGTAIDVGRNKYIWLGTSHVFRTFTFGFERTAAGWIWFHAYPFAAGKSTFIVECTPETWAGLGLDRMNAQQVCDRLQEIFAAHLDGQPLVDQRADLGGAGWLNFRRLTNERWHHGRVVLLGDAAHTTHFAIGSGTKLAIQDAMALASALAASDDLEVALNGYEQRRKAALAPLQRAAKASSEWFERFGDYADLPPAQFAYALSNRRGEYPTWRYVLHITTQRSAPRTLLRWALSARKWSRSRRRLGAATGRTQASSPARRSAATSGTGSTGTGGG
jgi:anthraniloyl-CoA monooxygenase